MAIGLALSLLVSLFLVRRYSRPLKQVRATALSLAEGDYNARTGILQRDEVGELAQAVDTSPPGWTRPGQSAGRGKAAPGLYGQCLP